MNLRCDDTFAEDEGWHAAAARYAAFLRSREMQRVLYLELGVGGNTPAIIMYASISARHTPRTPSGSAASALTGISGDIAGALRAQKTAVRH